MRGLIYDVVTGIAIIIGLVVVTAVMRANQNFIMAEAEEETGDEQVYLENIASREDTYYRISDVYGTFHTLLKNGNNSNDKSKWDVYDYTIIKCNGIVLSYADSASDRASKIASLESYLKGILDSQPNCKFKVERKASGGSEDVHRKVTYIFTKA